MAGAEGRVVGVGLNPFSPNVHAALLQACADLGAAARPIDLPTLQAHVPVSGPAVVADAHGPLGVTHLAPALLFWQEAAAGCYRLLERQEVRVLNPVTASELADDKAVTAVHLTAAGVPQVETRVLPQEPRLCLAAAEQVGWPVVVKRTHGAQGRWVRAASGPAELAQVLTAFAAEGRGALLLQPLVVEAAGRSLRLVVVRDGVVACTERTAAIGALQSNIGAGGSQQRAEPTDVEVRLAVTATAALGLGCSGVDLLRTTAGPLVLEVNAAPDFTSMRTHVPVDVARLVVEALLDVD